MRISALIIGVLLAACSKPPAAPTASPDPVAAPPEALTAAACEAQGGTVVGDIGDGAVHRPDYRCPGSGAPPIGAIANEPGGPVAIEGAVCCKQ
jgi:hypothetical protein